MDIFNDETVFLIVGAGNNTEKYGSKVFLDLKNVGYNVVAINNHEAEVHGTPAYPSVSRFLERTEELFDERRRREALAKIVVVLVIPPAAGAKVVGEAHLHGIRRVWFQPGAESDEAIAFCKAHGIDETHGACVMKERPT